MFDVAGLLTHVGMGEVAATSGINILQLTSKINGGARPLVQSLRVGLGGFTVSNEGQLFDGSHLQRPVIQSAYTINSKVHYQVGLHRKSLPIQTTYGFRIAQIEQHLLRFAGRQGKLNSRRLAGKSG